MWVAQITEPADQGEEVHQLHALVRRFPAYHFGIVSEIGGKPFIIARPKASTILFPEDEATEVQMLRFIVTCLVDELITGHMITDGQEQDAPPRG